VDQDRQIDYKNKWYVFAAVAMGLFLGTIDGSIVNIALPTLSKELNTDFSIVQWVVLAYLLVIVTLMLSIGRLADMIGKKPLYLSGLAIFTLGSVLCGLSNSVYMLIGFRVLQAIGAVMVMALGTAIVTEAFPAEQRGMALGLTGLMVSIGSIAGPTLGGIILGVFSWHWIFFVNLPIGLLGIVLAWRFVSPHRPQGGQRFDYAGAVTLFLGLFSLLIALTLGQNTSFINPLVLVLFVISIGIIISFVMLEKRMPQPMVDLKMFTNKLFSVNLVTATMVFICSAGTVLLIPFFLQNMKGFSSETAGLLMAATPLSMGIIAPFSGRLSDRLGTRPLTVIGLFLIGLGYLGLTTLDANTSGLGFVLRSIPLGIGMGVFNSPNNSAVMGSVSRNRLGVASGLLSLTRTLGQTTGIAVIGALWASHVKQLSGALWVGDATLAPIPAQIAGFHSTLLVIVVIIFVALFLSATAWFIETRNARQAQVLERDSDKAQGLDT
jgi:EmrB/QacA subfamily drug resistance transporter